MTEGRSREQGVSAPGTRKISLGMYFRGQPYCIVVCDENWGGGGFSRRNARGDGDAARWGGGGEEVNVPARG